MSVFGGDSWGSEAQCRKRRVDDLLVENISDSSYFKKLPSGKYACLVCPNKPIFDTSLILTMHNKGSRHVAVVSRLKEKELKQQEEMSKRIALSDDSTIKMYSSSSNQRKEGTQNQKPEQNSISKQHNETKSISMCTFFSSNSAGVSGLDTGKSLEVQSGTASYIERKNSGMENEDVRRMLAEHQLELAKHREKELNFTAAGWKRDCHGKWFQDENVEFDSDEEDPNVCLS
ncbi:hypothetical protein MKW94_010149 [Papaver nudicaule]|uniref:Sodium channel modifier 1 n=1 Tax=Papaver nudicaule TaxID=74823 RepID=A0AA41VVI8_PAPNU|nr:hypothetical protein [Papaver nudicaule]